MQGYVNKKCDAFWKKFQHSQILEVTHETLLTLDQSWNENELAFKPQVQPQVSNAMLG